MRLRNSAYVPEQSVHPFQGIDYQDPSTLTDPHLSPEAQNVNFDKGHLVKRLGDVLLGNPVSGIPLAVIEFTNLSNVTTLLLITTTKEYKWDGSDWVDITYTTFGGAVTNRTGSEDNGLDWTVVSGIDSTGAFVKWIIITNGKDKPRWWDGTNGTFWLYSTAAQDNANRGAGLLYTNFVTCKTISTLSQYVLMGNVTTTTDEVATVAWSDTGSLYDFGTGILGQGNSGAIPLTDAIGPIQKIMVLGDRTMIYANDTIHAMTHVGGNDIFSFERLLNDTRLASPRAIVDIGMGHLFLGQENIYMFDGSRNLYPLADAIALRLREELQTSLKGRAWAFLDKAKNNIYWSVPTSEEESTLYKMEYNQYDIRQIRWTKHLYPDRTTTMGFWSRTTDLKISDLGTLTYNDIAWTYSQASIKAGFPQRVLGFSGGVSVADDSSFDDSGIPIEAFWDSIDFTSSNSIYLTELTRWTKLELELRGGSVDVWYSIDRGSNFILITTQTLTSDWTRYKFDIDVTTDTLRIRIGNNVNAKFELRWLRLMGRPMGE